MEVGIRDLRGHLRQWIDAVQRGEEVTVTERGKPVARLTGVSSRSTYERLVAEGVITPARRPRRPDSAHIHLTASGSVSDTVVEQRR